MSLYIQAPTVTALGSSQPRTFSRKCSARTFSCSCTACFASLRCCASTSAAFSGRARNSLKLASCGRE